MLYLMLTISLVGWITIYYLARLNKPDTYKVKPVKAEGLDLPLVSIIIPARNEEASLPRCLAGVRELGYPAHEVIIIDDQSTDKTHAIAASAAKKRSNLKVIRSRDLPSGWTGKNWANHQGALAAGGEWLLFIDANTEFYPNALSGSMAYAKAEGMDMVSLFPRAVMDNFWDKITLPIVSGFIVVGAPLHKVNDPDSTMAMAIGAFILIKRSTYEAAGGHAAIRGEIVDDRELAILVKSSGYKIRVLDGTKIYQVRMYEGFKDLWEGWSKNLFLGMDKSYIKAGTAIVFIFLLHVFPLLALVGWLYGAFTLPNISLGLGGMILLVNLSIFWIVSRIHRAFNVSLSKAYILCWPLGGAIIIGVIINSIIRCYRGIPWKGRIYT